MRLISVTSNQPTFRSVTFRRTGPSYIVGDRGEQGDAKALPSTYNGVGKSLLLTIIHFCLGSSKNDEFAEKLKGWEWTLAVEFDDGVVNLRRSVDRQNEIWVNDVKMSLKKYQDLLLARCFIVPQDHPNLTFRALFSHFVRPRRECYVDALLVEPKSTPFQSQLRLAFLMGLDVALAYEKHDNRKRQEQLKASRANLQNDPHLKRFLNGDTTAEIEIADLDQELERLLALRSEFKVADNYEDVAELLRSRRREMRSIANDIAIAEGSIERIDVSLNVSPDLKPEDVESLYAQANVALPGLVKRRLLEVQDFYASLLATRTERLSRERTEIAKQLRQLRSAKERAKLEVDRLNQFLGEHGALTELISLDDRISSVKGDRDRLSSYKQLVEAYTNEIQSLSVRKTQADVEATSYIRDSKLVLAQLMTLFRQLTERVYGRPSGGITVDNNTGDNQIRYDIDAHIRADASDGINEVKVFAFDMTLLVARRNHRINFLCHDSRLYSDIDPRQRARVFEAAAAVSDKEGLQYIATVNRDQLDAVKGLMADAFVSAIEDRIVLTLTGETSEGKLLGVDVDLKHDAFLEVAA